ncbi:dihydrofolate reductase family protein [Nocardioides sp. AE5]|uniref:dihydrofolate reductase family protein n=1 Tax=Nocardioides sp. AE5 TaxID=2962573 RepID=UPI0028822277|nr:dihydrofolate reductase family protein [Nocardioides sp. AE5]MDT0201575.1 dihydrofolate reductase family protein [Nocardioides sp. AE5]
MKILLDTVAGQAPAAEATDEQLQAAYAVPATPWLRVNFVETVDGAATGASGKSGSINNAADKRIFDLLRDQADVVLIGAGTARIEGYRPADRPIVVVSARGEVPQTLRDAPAGRVLVATHAESHGLAALRADLGEDHVLVVGERRVDLAALKTALVEKGFANILSEGGPTLFADLLDAGVVDEVCTTTVPRLIGGEHIRIAHGRPLDVGLELATLLEEDSSLVARWLVRR